MCSMVIILQVLATQDRIAVTEARETGCRCDSQELAARNVLDDMRLCFLAGGALAAVNARRKIITINATMPRTEINAASTTANDR